MFSSIAFPSVSARALTAGLMAGLAAYVLCAATMASANPGSAAPAVDNPANPSSIIPAKERRVVAKVDGMVCGMCVQAITKKLEETGKVTRVKVDLKGKTVEFGLKNGAVLSDDEIRKALEEAGYSMTGLSREG
jgi:copper chaperone CopZ